MEKVSLRYNSFSYGKNSHESDNDSETLQLAKELMMMIEEFVAEFEKFNEFDAISELADNAKATLFGVYCQMVGQKAQPKAQPKAQKRGRIRKPNASATTPQIGFIEKLMAEGRLDEDIDTGDLTRQAASNLIEVGLKRKKQTHRLTPDVVEADEIEDEDEQDPGGAFNHQTGPLFATSN